MKRKGEFAATTMGVGEGKHSGTVCTYFKMASVKLPRVVSGLILMHKCQAQKATLTCAPGLKQNVLKTFYLLIGVTRPFSLKSPRPGLRTS